jgi:hypothetical protein
VTYVRHRNDGACDFIGRWIHWAENERGLIRLSIITTRFHLSIIVLRNIWTSCVAKSRESGLGTFRSTWWSVLTSRTRSVFQFISIGILGKARKHRRNSHESEFRLFLTPLSQYYFMPLTAKWADLLSWEFRCTQDCFTQDDCSSLPELQWPNLQTALRYFRFVAYRCCEISDRTMTPWWPYICRHLLSSYPEGFIV